MLKNKVFYLLILEIFLFLLLTYRLIQVPTGLTVDESAFGWNAALLSKTGHDQNGKFLPLFVSSINNSDWRQPWTQYYLTVFFKIFGISVYNLRLSSVILILFSSILLFKFVTKLLDWRYALVSVFLFVFTPIIFMHSHLGLDNIMPIPFAIIWLNNIYQYQLNKKDKYLIYSAIALGASFYTYKGMRAVVPIWATLSVFYVIYLNYKPKINTIKLIKKTLPFIFAILPFFLIIPYLSHLYPGAIFGGARPKISDIYTLVYAYFSHFDLNFLFIKGDALLFHSTQKHGMMLLMTAPLFFIGIYQSIRKKSFWLFITLTFFSAPLLYGLVDSVYRASRIQVVVPSYVLICILGLSTITKYKYSKIIISFLTILTFLNLFSFLKYYWFTYPKFTENIFGNMNRNESYRVFAKESQQRDLPHYVDSEAYEGFFDNIYFDKPSIILDHQEIPPPHSIYLSTKGDLPGFEKLDVIIPDLNILLRQ